MELTRGRILLREFVARDVGALHTIHSDPRVLRYYAPEVGTPEHVRMLVEMFIQWANENPRQNFQFAIVDLKTNALLGSCGVRRKGCSPGQAEFGIGIGGDWWGKGIAQEAARTILRFGFSELDLHEVHGVAVFESEAVTKFAAAAWVQPGKPSSRRRLDGGEGAGAPWCNAPRSWTPSRGDFLRLSRVDV